MNDECTTGYSFLSKYIQNGLHFILYLLIGIVYLTYIHSFLSSFLPLSSVLIYILTYTAD